MPSPTTLTSLLLFIFFFLSLGFLLFYLLVKYKRRKTIPSLETEDSAPLFWTPTAAPPPPPPLPSQEGGDETGAVMGGGEGEGEQQRRRKKRGKKKRQEPPGAGTEEAAEHKKQHHRKQQHDGHAEGCKSYPFSSFASATQRKIKLQYDQLVRSNQAKALTIEQVGKFINCLVEARNELQQKSEIIQRSFKIKKALLFKADRSSFDRLCQQIYKLEAEHKRLEEDAAVYNLLQEQLKLSPAYKTMLEISANMELKPELDQAAEFPDISFEELLAQEKKDVFWQRYTNLRSTAK